MDKGNETRLKYMIHHASDIIKKNKEIEKIKGEQFNLFYILDRDTDEVKTHSVLIAELLNAKGSHNKGEVFLKFFIDMLMKKQTESRLWERASIPGYNETCDIGVQVEKDVGQIFGIGSRLDIFLSNKQTQICIENKIDAQDGKLQLERYLEYLKRDTSKINLLIYLTKFGKQYKNEKETSLKNGEDYFCLSYSEDILMWLENCMKECFDLPILRESIKQYIILIKGLTNQLTSRTMQNEVHKIILSDIEGAEIIKNEYENAIKFVSNDIKEKVIEKLKTTNIADEITISNKVNGDFSSLFITYKGMNDTIGIESFNGKGHEAGALFIGKMDFKRTEGRKYVHYYWIDGTIERIWDKQTLYKQMQMYGQNIDTDKIVQEIVDYIYNYIQRNFA